MAICRTLALIIACLSLAAVRTAVGADPLQNSLDQTPPTYELGIRPLLQEKCVACHGPLRAEAGLRLDAIQLIRQGGESGRILDGATYDETTLWKRISSLDSETRMPPQDEGVALAAEQIERIAEWLQLGAPGPESESFLAGPREHWAYRPIIRPAVPTGDEPTESLAHPLDRLVLGIQQARGVQPVQPATSAVWLRRLFFDVTGLPPTLEQVTSFEECDTPQERLRWIDTLLASPEYGQRWGRHWMDVWRYSDWDGYKNELRGSQRHIWHWRDWIVESLNQNKPYDQMLREMLAGDEIAPGDGEVVRATGFLARNYHISNRNIWLDATVEHTAKAFLGLTINCARCHDHKYDPAAQQDYYRMRAIFEPHRTRTDQLPGQPDVKIAGIPRVYDAEPGVETFVYARGDEKQPIKDKPVAPGALDWLEIPFLVKPVDMPLTSYYPELSNIARKNAIEEKRRVESETRESLSKVLVASASSSPAASLLDGDPDQAVLTAVQAADQQAETVAGVLLRYQVALADRIQLDARYAAELAKYCGSNDSVRHELASQASQAEFRHRRLMAELKVLEKKHSLAKARTAEEKDPTKRDRAIEEASKALTAAADELAKLGSLPPEDRSYAPIAPLLPKQSTGRRLALANWITHRSNPLTARVAVNHIWMRHFDSPLVESVFDFGMKTPEPPLVDVLDWLAAELLASGWDMKHLHRIILSSRLYALDSEAADAALAHRNAATDPDNRLHWRSRVRRLDAEEIRDSVLAVAGVLDRQLGGPDIDEHEGEASPRRSLYFRHAYEKQMPLLVLFDTASPNECYRRRPSVIPQQALALANSTLVRDMSRQLVDGMDADSLPDTEFVLTLFRLVLGRAATAGEQTASESFLAQQRSALSQPDLTEAKAGSETRVPPAKSIARRARQSLALVLFNHHDFVVVR